MQTRLSKPLLEGEIVAASVDTANASSDLPAARRPTVAVIITTYNHANYLPDAVRSALAQSRPADEIIVVDDGSQDDPAAVVSTFPAVALVQQYNQGLSAARNAGLTAVASDFVVFLDADDRLLPIAIEAGLSCHGATEGLAFAYGAHRRIAADGTPLGADRYTPAAADTHRQLLESNPIGMHATVMYRRAMILAVGGFDTNLRRCEDYDVYLRLARSGRIRSHSAVVAEYRKHEHNMSSNSREMLRFTLRVQGKAAALSERTADIVFARRQGRANWRNYYLHEILTMIPRRPSAIFEAATVAPRATAAWLVKGAAKRVVRAMSRRHPRRGRIRFGDFAGLKPVDCDFGFGRGRPVDRFYVEAFLSRHEADIAGHVLEVGDDSYSRRFGGGRIVQQDVLHVETGNAAATIVGNIAQAGVLPLGRFDCIVLTQTLHLIYDMRAAIAQLHGALKPGGVLLVTVPGVSSVDRGQWGATWFWSLTTVALERLLTEHFGNSAVEVCADGNVFAATCFLQGLALEDVDATKLCARDPAYPVIVSARAWRAPAG